ncbi:MAG: glycerol-3-phosphate dehydrogenase/oxidase [Chloroflexi bacterium]|nr:glycerol-3-phosphate dehydrogenase/oxidase [Chloroflexota bacterium]
MELNRDRFIDQAKDTSITWDLIVIGGGATGLGTAVDAASRGYRTVLLERDDFGSGTSSRSTKLAHGGIRYLAQRDFSLVREALRERNRMLRNAPHLVRKRSFVIPVGGWAAKLYYGAGLKLYDLLGGARDFGRSRMLSRDATLQAVPTLKQQRLYGGLEYFDGQFDDARMAICLAQTAADYGATVINHIGVSCLLKTGNRTTGVEAIDQLTGETLSVSGKVVVNAAGIFVDEIGALDNSDAEPTLAFSQGSHIVLDRRLLPGESALVIPATKDGRVLFAIPWHGVVLAGTTDIPVPKPLVSPKPAPDEVDFLLTHLEEFLVDKPTNGDVRSVFAGIRPLLAGSGGAKTSSLSRSHAVFTSENGLVTVAGGKWTTYRQMAEDAVNRAAVVGGLARRTCVTSDLRLAGYPASDDAAEGLDYGFDASQLNALEAESPPLREPIHPCLPYRKSHIVHAVRNEMALTLEDALSRRTRSLLLDARASIEAAPAVAELMARELGKDVQWTDAQVKDFSETARGYMLPGFAK